MEKVKHKADCSRVWKRYDATCPRCVELIAGADPRKGWGSRRVNDERQSVEIQKHFTSPRHLSGECGLVCTYGDW